MLNTVLDRKSTNNDFPLVITFEDMGVSLKELLVQDQETFKSNLLKHGAILFKGFSIDTVEKFETIMSNVTLEKKNMDSGLLQDMLLEMGYMFQPLTLKIKKFTCTVKTRIRPIIPNTLYFVA